MAHREAPVIGVTGPDKGGAPAWLFTWLALRRAGARAVHLTPRRPREVAALDGLVLGGGADVTDGYDQERGLEREVARPQSLLRRGLDRLLGPVVLLVRLAGGTRSHGADRGRDRLELELLSRARELDLPVLGICRGAQLMNLLEQGTLHRHLDTLYEERARMYTVLPRREVQIEPDSRLAAVLGRRMLAVNSLHYHAVAEPGRDMRIVARELSGVAQAIEHARRAFWIGVQWHPEYLPQHPVQQELFRALVRHARVAHARRLRAHAPQRSNGALPSFP